MNNGRGKGVPGCDHHIAGYVVRGKIHEELCRRCAGIRKNPSALNPVRRRGVSKCPKFLIGADKLIVLDDGRRVHRQFGAELINV